MGHVATCCWCLFFFERMEYAACQPEVVVADAYMVPDSDSSSESFGMDLDSGEEDICKDIHNSIKNDPEELTYSQLKKRLSDALPASLKPKRNQAERPRGRHRARKKRERDARTKAASAVSSNEPQLQRTTAPKASCWPKGLPVPPAPPLVHQRAQPLRSMCPAPPPPPPPPVPKI